MAGSRKDGPTVRAVPEPKTKLPWLHTNERAALTHGLAAKDVNSRLVPLVGVCAIVLVLAHLPLGLSSPLNTGLQVAAQELAAATPDRADTNCTVAPRPFSEIASLADAPPGQFQLALLCTPISEITTPTPPVGGDRADPELTKAVTAAVHELYACMNSGDMLHATALWTDDYLRHILGGLDIETLASSATPVTVPATDRAMIIAVDDVRLLADGRVSALARSEGRQAVHIFVVQADGRYLLDGVFEITDTGTPVP